jgi:DNA-binding transcriptional regulator YiaG
VGVAKPTVASWEHRGTRPGPDVLKRLVKFLGYEPDEAATSPAVLVRQLTVLRQQLRLARSELAEMLGLAYETLWAWETGRRKPRGRSVALLREFLIAQQRRIE